MTRKRLIIGTLAASLLVPVPVMRAVAGETVRPLPTCAQLGTSIPRPAAVPPAFPVPRGTRFTEVTTSAAGTKLVLGYAPLGLRDAASWYRRQITAAGYRQTSADAELVEAEARFAGEGTIGLWRVNVIRGCANAVVLTLGFAGRPGAGSAKSS
jgi:hypothetical protein